MIIEHVNLIVADQYLARFDQVVHACEQAGLKVEQQLKDIGVIGGTIDSEKVPDLYKVPGVSAVERSRSIQISPPESDTQ